MTPTKRGPLGEGAGNDIPMGTGQEQYSILDNNCQDLRARLERHTIPFLACLNGCTRDDAWLALERWRVFDDDKARAAASASPFRPRHWRGTLDDAAPELGRLNALRAGVFLSTQVSPDGGTKPHVKHLRAWTCDLDSKDATEPFDPAHDLPLPPTMLVRTGNGWHVWWLAEAPEPVGSPSRIDEHEAELKAITAHLARFGGDKSTCEVARVLRLPGFFHCKADPRLVTLEVVDGPRYTREQIRAAFPPVQVATAVTPEAAHVATEVAPAVEVDRGEVVKRAEAYMSKLPGGVQGEDGSGATFQAALKVATRFALTQRETLGILTRIHNPKCAPPWSDAELQHKAHDAWQAAQSAPNLGEALRGGRPAVRGFEWQSNGLYRIVERRGPDGGTVAEAVWIAPPFEVPGLVRDEHGDGWAVLLSWADLDGRTQEQALGFDDLSGEGTCLRVLERKGLLLPVKPSLRADLMTYLKRAAGKVQTRIRTAEHPGWHGTAYMLPNGRSIGATAGEPLRLAGGGDARAVEVRGTLEGWQNEVATLAVGSPFLAFAIASAFAGPLLSILGAELAGGFNLLSQSSRGKTTSLEAACSAWGNPARMASWRATTNGLEGLAAAAHDGFLPLDELGQIDPREAGAAAYLLANGQSKARALRDGSPRAGRSWSLVFLSSGEVSLEDKVSEDGKRPRAGMEVRLVDIPCPPSGILQELHGAPGYGELADRIKAASRHHHGHAGPAFVAALAAEPGQWPSMRAEAHRRMAAWAAGLLPPLADPQVRRVLQRLALVGLAGEMAVSFGILPWPAGTALDAATAGFHAWLDRRGHAGASETERGLRAVLDFLERHGSSRFEMWGDAETRVINRAGTRCVAGNPDHGFDYWLTVDGWREACGGLNPRDVARACITAGILAPGKGGVASQNVRIPGHGVQRVYVVRGAGIAALSTEDAA